MSEPTLLALRTMQAVIRGLPPEKPRPGILYRHYDADGVLLYIGSTDTQQMRDRHAAHAREARWWRYVARVEHEQVLPDRRAAFHAEGPAIRAELPVFNRASPQFIDEQELREARYVQEHSDVPYRWPRARRAGTTRLQRRDEIDAMLRELGVLSPPKCMSPVRHASLDLGEFLAQAYLNGED